MRFYRKNEFEPGGVLSAQNVYFDGENSECFSSWLWPDPDPRSTVRTHR